MIELDNHTDTDIDAMLFEPLLEELSSKDVELIIVNETEMRHINKQTRNLNQSTDVLSFGLEEIPDMELLGTVVICIDYVKKAALKYQHSESEELQLLFIHGLLHLLGMDHEQDKGAMRQKEHELIKHFKLPQSLIVRTEQI